MLRSRIIALSGLMISLITTSAHAVVIRNPYIGPEYLAGLAIEKSTDGKLFLLLDMEGNRNRVEYGVRPGFPFDGPSVFKTNEGELVAVFSVFSGEIQGLYYSGNVTLIDDIKGLTRQRLNLSSDILELAQKGELRDEEGKTYSASDIKEVMLVGQSMDDLDSFHIIGNFRISDIQSGSIEQIAGETISVESR